MRVALYARVSTERQQERGTVTSQLEALRAAADADGHEVIEEFVDDGYSGARLDRPALDRLRDAAEAGVLDGVICLCADRLARAYAYQVLILEELERFGISVQFLEGPAHGEDPQATLLMQMQGVIAEYERAKIAERYRRGKLYRARAGEIPFWKTAYGHRRVAPAGDGPARIEIFEPEAEIVREIFSAYVEQGRSVRQIAHDLLDRGIPSPTGKPIWGTSTITRLLNNEAYIGTVYYNRRESLDGAGPRGARNRKTRHRERPREEWIAIPVPAIIDRDTFDRVKQVSSDNSKWNPRGAEWGAWLLRELIECGHCHLGCNCHRIRGRNGTWHRYYYCRGHDLLRARSPEGRCPERNIRANELDEYVFQQVRQALLDPRQLIAAERAVIAGTPVDKNELVAAQLKRLDSALESSERERTRLLDAYQAALLDSTSSPGAPPRSPPAALSSPKRRTRSHVAAPNSPPRTGCAAGSPASPNASPPRSTTSTSKAADDCYDSSSRKSASAAGASRSTSRSRSPTTHPTTTRTHPNPNPTTHRQAICACVPFVQIDGDSYRMRGHRARLQQLRAGLNHPNPGGELP